MTTETSSIADKKSPFKALLTRFLCVYLLLFAFPFPLNAALSIPLILVAQLLAPFGIEMPMLLEVSNVLDHVTDTVVSLFTVPLGKIFGLTVILGPTGSGDTAHRFVRVALLATLSLLIALVWNWRKQGEFPSRKARWAHVWGRWWLAAIMIKYGVIKVFCQQFGAGENAHELVSAVGDYSPMHLAWVFMSHSPGYQRFAGFAELIPAILILHRRTALPGLLMMFGVLSNVFAMNLCFDIPVKLHSGHYLVATLVLLAPYWPRLRAFIRGENQVPTPNLYIKPKRFSENTWAKITLAMGTALVVASVAGTRLRSKQFESMQTPSPYAGRWDVQQTQRDGVPWHDAGIKGFKTLAIDNLGRFSLFTFEGEKNTLGIERDSTDQTLKLRHPFRRQKGITPSIEAWTVSVRETTAQTPNNRPTNMKDRELEIPVKADEITLKGRWDGHDYEIIAVRRPLPIEQPFRWIQEMPFQQ